tara:strand:- start:5195 stop:6025 length:831 start_codon:yes stop_codon:yes gene_type:complete
MAFKFPEDIDPNYNPNNSRTFKDGDQGSDNLANNHFQFLEFFHLPSSYFVAFKAYIENFTDDYASSWKTENVYGRMDPIATFERTTRKISCAFKVVASSVQEAEQNMRRISLLLQMLYPSYESSAPNSAATVGENNKSETVSTIKGSPLFKVKFLNWITNSESPFGGGAEDTGLMGYISGFSFKPQLDGGTFQIGVDLYPKYIDLSFTLNVIHEHPLGWGVNDRPTSGDFRTEPQNVLFPYGKNVSQKGKSKPPKLSSDQKFLELRSAANKLIGGE